MITHGIGVVLCRIAAVVLFVKAASNLSFVVPSAFGSFADPILTIAMIAFSIAAPLVAGMILWIFAERICRVRADSSPADMTVSVESHDLIRIGVFLIGLYTILNGTVSGVRTETLVIGQNSFSDNEMLNSTANRSHIASLRASYIAEVLFGSLLIIGRKKITAIFNAARRAGTNVS